jgi:aryl-alcohol dehydrogenase-like predicted oxidoreductase
MGGRFDPTRPENDRKHDLVEELAKVAAEAGCSLVHLALAFVLVHPAVTSAIVGPRTMEHLEGQLGATDVVLTDDVLDRIDELVAPGTNIEPGDAGYTPPAIESAWRRRRAQRS